MWRGVARRALREHFHRAPQHPAQLASLYSEEPTVEGTRGDPMGLIVSLWRNLAQVRTGQDIGSALIG